MLAHICIRKRLNQQIHEAVFNFPYVWKCLHWMVRLGCGSVPAWIRSTWGVSLLWGLCEALWARLLVSGCMFPIGCLCLTKTQRDSGLLKDAVSLFWCAPKEKKMFRADYISSRWWNTFILMRSSHTDRTILCNQHMNGIWMPLLCSHPARRDYTPVLTQTVISSLLLVKWR